jgi:NAD-dependent SIR2 family protein deacetylase
VVWFGEALDGRILRSIHDFINSGPVDMVLVVGTSSLVYPAAGYAEQARSSGTSVVQINIEAETPGGLTALKGSEDFAFGGDAAEVLPKLLEPVIGTWDEERGEFVKK